MDGLMQQQPKEFNPAEQRASLRENVPENLRTAYDRIVVAGMKFMFSDQTSGQVIEFLKGQGDIAEKLGKGVGALMLSLFVQSNKTMPHQLMIPAGVDLLLQAAEFYTQSGMGEVSNEQLAQAMQTMVFTILEKFGMGQEQVMGGIAKMQQAAGG